MTDTDSSPAAAASTRPILRWLLIGAALAATAVLPIVLGGRQALLAALDFSATGYLALLLLIFASWSARALKLRLLLRRLNLPCRFARALGISLATDVAFMVTPAGIGGYAASLYYVHRAGARASAAAAITAVDQGLDIAFFAIALPLAGASLVWSQAPSRLSTPLLVAAAALALIAFAATRVWRRSARLRTWAIALLQRWPKLLRLLRATREFGRKLLKDSHILLSGGWVSVLAVIALTVIQQLARYAVLGVVLAFLGYRVSFLLTFLLQALVLQAASWTGIPSGGGAAEIGLTTALASWVPTSAMGAALLIWRIATLYVCLIAGAIAMALLARSRAPEALTN